MDKLTQIEALIKEMGIAHYSYGCGFESEDRWCVPYYKLLALVGMDQQWIEANSDRLYRERWDPIIARVRQENAERDAKPE